MVDITEGVVIGVSSGVIVSALLWIKHVIDARWNRRKEIKRLRDIIEDFRNRIYTAEDLVFGGATMPKDSVRGSYFDSMEKQLHNALDRGSPNLTYDETQGIRDAISLPPEHFVKPTTYDQIFNNLEKLTWLKLPPRTE